MKLPITVVIFLIVFKSSDGMNKKGGTGQRMPEFYKNIIGALQNISIPLMTISESLIESNEKEIQKVMDENRRSGCDWSGLKKWSCCSVTNQCGENEGDCDSDAHCSNGLKCGTENCVGPHFNPLADCCFNADASQPPQAEVPSEDSEEGNKEKRNFYYHPTYAPSYKTKKPYTKKPYTSYYTKPPKAKCTTSKKVRFCEYNSLSVITTKTTDCIFPFTYLGKTYHSCTKDDAPEPYLWCATKVDGDGNAVKTGVCDANCPGVGADCDWSGSNKWSCCSTSNKCGVGEGDCDEDEDCAGALKCGSNNCFTDEGPGALFSSAADCCYDPNPNSCKCPPGQGINGICTECPTGFGIDVDGTCGLCAGSTNGGRPSRPGTNGGRPSRPGTDGGRPSRPGTDGGRPSRPGTDGGRPSRPGTDGGHPLRERPDDEPIRVKRQASGCRACSNVPIIDPVTGVCNSVTNGRPTRPGTNGGRPSRPGTGGGRPTRPRALDDDYHSPSYDDYDNEYEEY